MTANSSTSLYGTTTGNVTVSSTNLTSLYSGAGVNVRPSVGYGNANVERFLSSGTDGANTVTNIVNSGTITSGGNITAPWFIGNVVGNISGNIVVPGSNTQVLYNNNGNAGASADLTFDDSTNILDVNGNVVADYFLGNGSGLSSLTGANVTGQVPFSAVANSVAVANVSGIGNVAVLNLDGSSSNVLYGNGVFAPGGGGNAANANYANFAGTAFSVSAANVSGLGNIATINLNGSGSNVLLGNGAWGSLPNTANANYANFAGTAFSVDGANVSGAVNLANYATVANSVAGANVSGAVNLANYATVANSVALANVSGAGNIASINLDGNVSNVLHGDGTFGPESGNLSANYAAYAGNVTINAQPNITSVGTLTSLAVAGNITGPDVISFDTANGTGTLTTGQMSWDTAERTMSLGMLNGVTQQIGLESYILVKASAAIADGEVVMFTGADGNNVTAAPADVTSVGFQSEYVIGVATQSLATNDFGYITVFGQVHGLNTNAFNVGDILWLSTSTPGALTSTQPTDPNYQIQVAAVTKKSAGDGHIQVRVTPFASLTRLTDVEITTPATGDALVYNGSNVWINGVPAYANTANSVAVANVSGIGNIAVINLDGSSSNVLYGNGVFAPESETGNANYAAYAGNVTIASQGNITSLGNLVSLTVRDSNVSNPITQVLPTGNVVGTALLPNNMIRIDNYNDQGNANGVQGLAFVKSRGNSSTPAAAANNDPMMRLNSYVYNGNTQAKAVMIETTAPVAAQANLQLANTAWTGGQFRVTTGNPNGNVANASANSNQNLLQYNQSGGLILFAGTNNNGTTAPSLNIIDYGIAANGAGAARPMFFQRARGNRDGNVALANTDTLGQIGFQGYNGNAFFSTRFSSIRANVNTAHGTIANGSSIPTDLQFITCSNTTGYVTTFYGNGSASFPGAISTSNNISANNLTLTNSLSTGNSISVFMNNISTVNPSFAFSTYNNANALVNPYTFYRARGNASAGAAVVGGDIVSSQTYNVYGDSGNTYVSIASTTVSVNSNDGLGNVTGIYAFAADQLTFTANTNINLNGETYPSNLHLSKFNETVSSGGSVSGTITPDLSSGSIFEYTLTGDITFDSLANVATGSSATIILTQDGTGGHILTSSMLFSDGFSTLSTAAGAVDIVSVFFSGTNYYATLTTGYA